VSCVHTDARMGDVLLSGSWDGTLRSWDLRAPSARAALSTATLASRVLCAHARWPYAVVGLAVRGSVLLFDLRRPDAPVRTEGISEKMAEPPRCIALAPVGANATDGDGARKLTYCVATSGGRVAVQGVTVPYTFRAHCSAERAYAVNSLCFCALDDALLTCGSDGVVSIWNLRERNRVFSMPSAGQAVACAVFDGRGHGFAYAPSYDWAHGEEGADPSKGPEVRLAHRPAAANSKSL